MVAVVTVGLLLFQVGGGAGSDPRALLELGVKLAADGKLEPALDAFAKACKAAPKDEDACYYMARTLFALGRFQEASDPFEKARRAASKQELARANRAAALNFVALGRFEEAERCFREALQFHGGPAPPGPDPRIDYGAFLFRQGRMEEALPLLQAAVKTNPASAAAHLELGRILLHLSRPAAAAGSLERAVELDPRSSAAHLLLGRAYLELGRTEEGERQLRLGQEGWRQDYGSSKVR
jgi:tetratricopeptide (TPR) repeat protein